MWLAALAFVVLADDAATAPIKPLPAPPLYVTHNQGLAISIPRGLTYCPLPDDWVGTDHGVELYLTPPEKCGGAGYASIDRDSSPATPSIDVYYEFWTVNYVDHRPCLATLEVRMFGQKVRACQRRERRWITLEAHGIYYADKGDPRELTLTLKTTPKRYAADVTRFRAFMKGVSVCRPEWADGNQPVCPKTQWF